MTKAERVPAPTPIRTATEALTLLQGMQRTAFLEGPGSRHYHQQLIRLHVWITNLVALSAIAAEAEGRRRDDLVAELLARLPSPEEVPA